MKNIFYFICLLFVSTYTLVSCKEEALYPIETTINAFDLIPTTSGTIVTVLKDGLRYTGKDSIITRWSRTTAANGTPVYYTVLFIGANGDFENPVYTISSTNIGWSDTLKIEQTTLDLLAEKCGIASEGTGQIRWKVRASNGVNQVLSTSESSFTVKRPKGIAEIPAMLYMLGSATEAGDSIIHAIKGTTVDVGIFEFITTLKAGNYYFVDSKKEGAKTYQVNNGAISFGKISVSPVASEQLYKIRMVIYNAESTTFEIQKMELIIPDKASSNSSFPTIGLVISELDYTGKGVWGKTNIPALKPDGTAITNGLQYKFKMTGVFVGETIPVAYYFGYYTDTDLNANAGVPNNTSPESWYYCRQTSTLDKNFYRFGNAKDKKLDVTINLTPGLKNYFHKCVILED